MTHGVISIDSSLLKSMRNGKNVNFRGRNVRAFEPWAVTDICACHVEDGVPPGK